MQRNQLLGIILFAIGGGLGFFSFAYSVLFVETTYGLSLGIRAPFLSVPFAESLAISIGVGFVPFLLMGLGLYFIFQPYFSRMQRVAEAIEEREGERQRRSEETHRERIAAGADKDENH